MQPLHRLAERRVRTNVNIGAWISGMNSPEHGLKIRVQKASTIHLLTSERLSDELHVGAAPSERAEIGGAPARTVITIRVTVSVRARARTQRQTTGATSRMRATRETRCARAVQLLHIRTFIEADARVCVEQGRSSRGRVYV